MMESGRRSGLTEVPSLGEGKSDFMVFHNFSDHGENCRNSIKTTLSAILSIPKVLSITVRFGAEMAQKWHKVVSSKIEGCQKPTPDFLLLIATFDTLYAKDCDVYWNIAHINSTISYIVLEN